MQNTLEDLVTDRQNTVDFTAGKWSMQEEANLDVFASVAKLLPDHLWKEKEVVVVNPDQIVVADMRSNLFGEEAIDLLVGLPSRLVKGDLTGVVM